ncbi:MAG: hypothetical protein LBR80_07010 [Deltaproteobacteria bacterium]|nr:hypothetical protein [Deltaproteobacteria bacterium]
MTEKDTVLPDASQFARNLCVSPLQDCVVLMPLKLPIRSLSGHPLAARG